MAARIPTVWYRMGEKGLALSIIYCAIHDLISDNVSADDVASAKRFLFADSKEWAEHRQLIFDVAGIDPGWMKRKKGDMK